MIFLQRLQLGLARQFRGIKAGSVASDTFYVVVVQLLSRGVLNGVMIITAHVLTVAQFSSYNYFIITSSFLSAFLNLGLPLAATKLLAESFDQRGSDLQIKITALLQIFAGVALLAVLAAPLYASVFAAEEVEVNEYYIIVGAVAMAAFGITLAAAQGAHAFAAAVPPVAVGSFCLCGGAIWAALSQDVAPLTFGVILFYAVPCLMLALTLLRRGTIPRIRMFQPVSGHAFREIASSALPSLGAAVIFTGVNWFIARMLIEHQTSSSAFGQFAIGMQWFSLALFVPIAAGQAIFPRYVRRARAGKLSPSALVRPALLSFGMVVPLVAGGALIAPLLSLLYGDNYAFSPTYVALIVFAAALSAPCVLLGHFLTAAVGPAGWLRLYTVYLIIGIALPLAWPPTSELIAAVILIVVNLAMLTTALTAVYIWRHRLAPRSE